MSSEKLNILHDIYECKDSGNYTFEEIEDC
jgi:hypothetical protein